MLLILLSLLPLAVAPLATQEEPAPAQSAQEPAPGAPETAAPVTTPIVVSPEESAERERRLASLYEGTLLGAKDGEDFVETPAYRRLLEIVGGYAEGELTARAARRLDRTAALADPGAWRGEIVSLRGLIADITTVRLSYPIGEHVDVFRALLTEPDGTDGLFVDFLHQPPVGLDMQDDVVDTDAVFVRLVGYENKKGQQQLAPYLVARDLREFDASAADRKTGLLDDKFALILITAAVAYFVIRVLMTLRSKKGPDDPVRAARLLRERANAPLRPRPPAKP